MFSTHYVADFGIVHAPWRDPNQSCTDSTVRDSDKTTPAETS
jgi:hypothetical protein